MKQRIIGAAFARFFAVVCALAAVAQIHGIVSMPLRLAFAVVAAGVAAALSGVIRDWPGDLQ